MGGFGSGGANHSGRLTTDDALRLDVNRLNREGALVPGWKGGRSWHWSDGRRASIGIEAGDHGVRLRHTLGAGGEAPERVDEGVPLDREPCRFGGAPPFWFCPRCGRRVAVLYGLRRFRCRACHRLTYASRRERAHDRAQRRADRIRVALGGEPGWEQIPPRPRGMHHATYERLLAIVLAADDETTEHAERLLARIGGL